MIFLPANRQSATTTNLGLGNLIARNIKANKTARELNDKDKILFYKSRVNMPLYWLNNVRGEMEEYYKLQEQKNARARKHPSWPGYIPTKIEWAWERGDVPIPNLDPVAVKEERARLLKEQRMMVFIKGFYFDLIKEDEEGYQYNYLGDWYPLATQRHDAYQAFDKCDPDEYLDFQNEVFEKWDEATDARYKLPDIITRLDETVKNLKRNKKRAKKSRFDNLAHHYELEGKAVEAILRDLKGRV